MYFYQVVLKFLFIPKLFVFLCCIDYSLFEFLYTKRLFETSNFSVEEYFKFEYLKRVKENIFKTINLCKIKTNTQKCEKENIKKIE